MMRAMTTRQSEDRPDPYQPPSQLVPLPQHLYGEVVGSLLAAGADEADAERYADAALGPLKLLPPKPDEPGHGKQGCESLYFSPQGRWLWCDEPEGHHPDTFHYSDEDDSAEWNDDYVRVVR